MKVNPTASAVLFAKNFGGSGWQTIGGMATDAAGGIYVGGTTTSSDLPTTSGAFQRTRIGGTGSYGNSPTGFVVKWNPDATIAYATYLGSTFGDDQVHGVSVDSAGNAYITGATSGDFPVLNAFQPGVYVGICNQYTPSGTPVGQYYCAIRAGFLSALNPAGTALVWSTLTGGGPSHGLALDSSGNVYITCEGVQPVGTVLPSSPTGAIGVVKIAPRLTPLQFSTNAITNAFSFHPGLPHPGGLASIFVHGLNISGSVLANGYPLPTELAGVSILVDGKPAPLLGVANVSVGNPVGMQQINFQVPFDATSNQIELWYQGMSGFARPATVAPGILLLSDGSAAIQHATDYSLVTDANPAAKGETIIIYLTGLGQVNPPAETGMPATGPATTPQQPQLSIGGHVLYSGVTPGFVGLYQINFQLAQDIPSGDLDLSVNWRDSWVWPSVPANFYTSNTVKLPVQ